MLLYVGEYSLIKAEVGGAEVGEDQLSALGSAFNLKDNSKIAMTINGSELGDGEYKVDGDKITVTDPTDATLEMTKNNNTISFTEEGAALQ
jgi:hypothetical protein